MNTDKMRKALIEFEATQIYNETGKSPRELVEENEKLIALLGKIVTKDGFNTSSSLKNEALQALTK